MGKDSDRLKGLEGAVQRQAEKAAEQLYGFESDKPYDVAALREAAQGGLKIVTIRSPRTGARYGVLLVLDTLTDQSVQAIRVMVDDRPDEAHPYPVLLSRASSGVVHFQLMQL
jgi:hypothetical protein